MNMIERNKWHVQWQHFARKITCSLVCCHILSSMFVGIICFHPTFQDSISIQNSWDFRRLNKHNPIQPIHHIHSNATGFKPGRSAHGHGTSIYKRRWICLSFPMWILTRVLQIPENHDLMVRNATIVSVKLETREKNVVHEHVYFQMYGPNKIIWCRPKCFWHDTTVWEKLVVVQIGSWLLLDDWTFWKNMKNNIKFCMWHAMFEWRYPNAPKRSSWTWLQLMVKTFVWRRAYSLLKSWRQVTDYRWFFNVCVRYHAVIAILYLQLWGEGGWQNQCEVWWTNGS